jgi:hypothetical protein
MVRLESTKILSLFSLILSDFHSAQRATSGATLSTFPPYDLLPVILAETDKSTCIKAAVVCRAWYEPAMNKIWSVLKTARYIFEVLAPLEERYVRNGRWGPENELVMVFRC